jgi:hypothetical protein
VLNQRKCDADADKLEAWIVALFANAGLPVESIPDIRTATLSDIASSARIVADLMIGRPVGRLN